MLIAFKFEYHSTTTYHKNLKCIIKYFDFEISKNDLVPKQFEMLQI